MRYVLARYNEKQRAEICRIYVTDCLRLIAENTAKCVEGQYISKRYYDVVHGDMNGSQSADSRSGEEIAADVIKRLGLNFKEGGNENGDTI